MKKSKVAGSRGLSRLMACTAAFPLLALGFSAPAAAKPADYTVLYTFTNAADGGAPSAGLVKDSAGNFYGTTNGGGLGFGTVYKVAPDGTETVLYSFTGGSDGSHPSFGALTRDTDGNLYGTTSNGGIGQGVVFKVAPDGTETVIHAFAGGQDGSRPHTGVIRDFKGNLYGTTNSGGADNAGTIFKIAADGTETVLYAFSNSGVSVSPGYLTEVHGKIFGNTESGGNGNGSVFQLVKGKKGTFSYQNVYTFTGGTDGGVPVGKLTFDKAGNLYGTTSADGAHGDGTVFKLTPNGSETVLHAFAGGSDGANPNSGVFLASDGMLYGTTVNGGFNGVGSVFALAPDGTLTTLHSFTFGDDGAYPGFFGPLVAKGLYLYGTAAQGGPYSAGIVFKVKK